MHLYPVLFSLSGTGITPGEAALFRRTPPAGFILFRRNVENPTQVKALTAALREYCPLPNVPILIDQEGGRVQRLSLPHWEKYPVPATLKTAADVYASNYTMAAELAGLGITVNCTPLLDVAFPQTHEVIGDRAFSSDPAEVARKGQAVVDAHIAAGVVPIVKHIPGHGRAAADSHLTLPVVTATRADIEAIDFAPFRAVQAPWAMTAHLLYTALDPVQPATLSTFVIKNIIRDYIGFSGILVSDDLGMKALTGSWRDKTLGALAAGCDLVLHCSGNLDEMQAMAQVLPPMPHQAVQRLVRSMTLQSV
ncbi:MAG: beta-N-acetylhexosaminidase [Holosporales bacterium]